MAEIYNYEKSKHAKYIKPQTASPFTGAKGV